MAASGAAYAYPDLRIDATERETMAATVYVTQTGTRYHARTDLTCMENARGFMAVDMDTADGGCRRSDPTRRREHRAAYLVKRIAACSATSATSCSGTLSTG